MAEEISDGQFKAEMLEFKSDVMKFIGVANQKFDGLTADVRTNAYKLDRLENGLVRVEAKVDRLENGLVRVEEKVDHLDANLKAVSSDLKLISGQFKDVALMAMKDHTRIDGMEKRVDDLETGIH